MFKKKETLLENMAFMAIIAAINVVCSLLMTFLPVISVFIIIFLPFFSAVVALLCKWKYYPIYLFASIGVSFAATFYKLGYTVFYLIPSLLTGFLFGLCIKKKLSGTYSILSTSLIQLGLTYAFIPLIQAIYGVNIIDKFIELLKLNDHPYVRIIAPSFIFLISLIQMVFSYIVIDNEMKKIEKENTDYTNNEFVLICLLGGVSLLSIPFTFFFLEFAYLFMFIALFIAISIFINLIAKHNKLIIIISSICLGLGFIFVFAFYSLIQMPYTLLFINVSNILIFIIALLYNQVSKKNYDRLS